MPWSVWRQGWCARTNSCDERQRDGEPRPVFQVARKRIERAPREPPVIVGPLRSRGPHVLVDVDETAGAERLPDFGEHALDLSNVVERAVKEDDVVKRARQVEGVDVVDAIVHA